MAQNGTAIAPNGFRERNSPEPDRSFQTSPPNGTTGYGMTPAVLRTYSGKADEYGRFHWRIDNPEGIDAPSDSTYTGMWAIVVRYIRTWDGSEQTFTLHSIIVQSPLLQGLLGEVFKGYPGFPLEWNRLVFMGR